MTTENLGAVTGVRLLKGKFISEGAKDIASAGVPNPASDIFFFESCSVEDRAGMAGGEGGNFGSEEVAQKAAAVVEAEKFTVFRGEV